jgi:hypothetical protein
MKIIRSFFKKLNTGNYTTADFGCSMEDECEVDELEARSKLLHDYCREDVEESIKEYEQEIVNKKILAGVSVDSPNGVVDLDLGKPTKELKFGNVKLA